MKTSIWTGLAGALALSLLGACEGTRPLTYRQGDGDNLYRIADIDGATFSQQTGPRRFRGQTSRADEVIPIDGFDRINSLDAVELAFDEGFFAEVDLQDLIFYGRPEHEYRFRYQLTDDYLVLTKEAAKADLPSQELTYATKIGDDLYRVPVMGLPIELISVEVIRDPRGRDTRQVGEYTKDFKHEATHFRVDYEGIKYFDAPGKQDLLRADYFNESDEWFYTKTLVGRPIDSRAILGSTVNALKIKFARTNNSIIGVDLNIADEQQVLDPTKTITVLEFPVEWADFRTDVTSDDAYLKETKLGDENTESKFWADREYALMDFNNADRLDKAFTLDNKLEKLEIGENYLSFNIYESGTGYTYKYSMAKDHSDIQGQRMPEEDALRFHVFKEKKTVIGGAAFQQRPDVENIVFANRMFPEGDNPEIVYHLSENSPETPEFVEAAKIAVAAWDEAFQHADTGIRVRFADERVQLGDVRYNQIVLYGYEIDSRLSSGGMLLGFGPSLQDTRTGRTYSAATHIYLRAYREGLLRSIRSYVRFKLGLYEDKLQSLAGFEKYGLQPENECGLFGPEGGNSNDLLGAAAGLVDAVDTLEELKESGLDPYLAERIRQRLVRTEGHERMIENHREMEEAVYRFLTDPEDNRSLEAGGPLAVVPGECGHANVAANAGSWCRIEAACLEAGSPFKTYLDDLVAAHAADPSVMNLPGEEEALYACAQPLMKTTLISTLIHEIGHNLGLGHNFAASSDKVNHAEGYPSSSVMDYPDRDFDLFDAAGPYDVATIRYLYGRQVEATDGSMVTIQEGESADDAARREGKSLRSFRMCTDYEVLNGNLPYFNPNCVRWDHGATPDEFVQWAINKIQADIIQNGFRYNNATFGGVFGATRYFAHFRQIHDYFRYLMRREAGLYFERISNPGQPFTEEDVVAAIERTEPEVTRLEDKLAFQYWQAVKRIYAFSRFLINLPSRGCLVSDGSTVETVIEFRNLREQIYERSDVTVHSCREAAPHLGAVYDVVGLGGFSPEQVSQFQLQDLKMELEGLELDLDPDAAANGFKQKDYSSYLSGGGSVDFNPLYSSGLFALKQAALQTLLYPSGPTMAVTLAAGVSRISFMDMPDNMRQGLLSDLRDHLLQGVRAVHYDEVRFASSSEIYPHFREYEDLLQLWTFIMAQSVRDQRSVGFSDVVGRFSMYRLRNQNELSQQLGQNPRIWYWRTTTGGYVYQYDGTIAGDVLKTLHQATMATLTGASAYAMELSRNDVGNALEQALAERPAEEWEDAAYDFIADGGIIRAAFGARAPFQLQPLQQFRLRALVAAAIDEADAAATLENLLSAMDAFLNDPLMQDGAVKRLIEIQDTDNLEALQATLFNYTANFF